MEAKVNSFAGDHHACMHVWLWDRVDRLVGGTHYMYLLLTRSVHLGVAGWLSVPRSGRASIQHIHDLPTYYIYDYGAVLTTGRADR